MSLAIETDDIIGVLLADGWHTVDDGSFGIDSYEYMWHKGLGDRPMLGGGQEEHVAASGFSFIEHSHIISGPLTSVLAVKRFEDT